MARKEKSEQSYLPKSEQCYLPKSEQCYLPVTGKLVKGKASEVNEVNSMLQSYREDINEILREAMFHKKNYPVEIVERKFRMKIGELSASNEFFKIYQEFTYNSKATKSHATIVITLHVNA